MGPLRTRELDGSAPSPLLHGRARLGLDICCSKYGASNGAAQTAESIHVCAAFYARPSLAGQRPGSRREEITMDQAAARLHSPAQPGGTGISSRALDTGMCLVPIKGEIDLASAPALRSALVRLRQRGNRHFVLDLSGVTHMDSTGLGVLLSFYRTLGSTGAIAIAAPPENVLALLKVTGLDQRFAVFPSVDEAIAGCHR